jgi:hypothetical protein
MKVLFSLLFLATTHFASAQRVVAVSEPNGNHVGIKGCSCAGKAFLYENGYFTAVIQTRSDNKIRGCSAAILWHFYDAAGEEIFQIQSSSYGVNRHSRRTENYQAQVEDFLAQQVRRIDAEPVATPKRTVGRFLLQAAQKYIQFRRGQ